MQFDWKSFEAIPGAVTAAKIGSAYFLALPTGWYREKQGHMVRLRTFPIVAMACCGYMLVLGLGGPGDMSRLL